MSQDQISSSDKTASHATSDEQQTAGISLQLGDKNLRVDDSHLKPVSPVSVTPPQPLADSSEKTSPPSSQSSPVSVGVSEDALLADAGRVFEQLRIRLAELDHREQAQQEKIQEVEQRETQFSRWVEQTRQDLTSRENRLMELETESDRRQKQLDEQATQLEQQQKIHLESTLKLQQQREEQEQRFQETEAELEQLRKSRLDEIERIERESEETLSRKRNEFEQACHEQLEQIKQQQAQATRRLRLQEDHLKRLRNQTEQQRNALKLETQRATQKHQQHNEQFRRRATQLCKARGLLDERFAAFSREQQIAKTTLKHQREQLLHEQQQFQEIQAEFKQIQLKRETEYESRLSILDTQQQQLHLQQQRLLKTREQIIETHQDNLELRLAFDEQVVNFALEAGQTPDEEGLRASREKLDQFYQEQLQQLKTLQSELATQEQNLTQKHQTLKKYEVESRQWIAEGITRWEEQRRLLEQHRLDANQQNATWETKLNRLLAEREEAEGIIRDLLSRLEQASGSIQ